jgi:hypothetical protein
MQAGQNRLSPEVFFCHSHFYRALEVTLFYAACSALDARSAPPEKVD